MNIVFIPCFLHTQKHTQEKSAVSFMCDYKNTYVLYQSIFAEMQILQSQVSLHPHLHCIKFTQSSPPQSTVCTVMLNSLMSNIQLCQIYFQVLYFLPSIFYTVWLQLYAIFSNLWQRKLSIKNHVTQQMFIYVPQGPN